MRRKTRAVAGKGAAASKPNPGPKFHAVVKRYLDEYHRLFPQQASDRGLTEYDSQLGENDAKAHESHGALIGGTLRAVEAMPEAGFRGDDWLDRRGFLSMLRTSAYTHGPLARWQTNPQIHCDAALDSVLLLLVRNSDRLAKVRPAVESRLAQIPRFLEQGAKCLRRPVPLWTRLARQTCAGADSFFADVAAQFGPLGPNEARFRRLCKDANEAFRAYADAAGRAAPGPAGGYAVGRDGFEFLLRENTGFVNSLPEIRAQGEALVAEHERLLAEEARKFGRASVAEILAAAATRWKPKAATLAEEYQRRTSEVRGQFDRAKIMTFPEGERCRVLQVPQFLQHHFPTAAYHQPPAYSRDQTGIFWVNDLSATQRDPLRRAAEVSQHFGLDFTCAHEAYPGHHLQFVIQNRHPSKIRRLMHHAIGYEGWTLWCEKMAVDQGVITMPEARLIQLHDALWRAHRIVIDCGLHDGTLTYAAACRRLQAGVGFTAARARGDVNWYTASPTVPLSYLLGRLEMERLHRQLCGPEGWTLQQFNDWVLSHGAIPQRWIWEGRLRG